MIQAQIMIERTKEVLLDKNYTDEGDMEGLMQRLNDYCILEGLNQLGELVVRVRKV